MADRETDIFKSLVNFHIGPPKDFFKRIWNALGHTDKSIDPSLATTQEIDLTETYSTNELELFRSLQDHIITPPAFSTLKLNNTFANIAEASTTKKDAAIINFKFLGRIAAALLVLTCSAYAIYYATHRNKDVANVALNNEKINTTTMLNAPAANTGKALSGPAKQNNPSVNAVVKINKPLISKNNSWKKSANIKGSNTGVQLEDNDILLTLVSYKYKEYGPLMKEIEKYNKVTINQFSYINISEKMNDVLKAMYATKRNNKPTRKARKLKAKLDKWKKSDEKHFDANTQNDPIDIIDLSEFILK